MVFSISPLPPWSVVDAAMARIEHNDRTRIGLGAGLDSGGRLPLPILERDGAHEGFPVDGAEIEHQARRLLVGGIEHEGLVDAGGRVRSITMREPPVIMSP